MIDYFIKGTYDAYFELFSSPDGVGEFGPKLH